MADVAAASAAGLGNGPTENGGHAAGKKLSAAEKRRARAKAKQAEKKAERAKRADAQASDAQPKQEGGEEVVEVEYVSAPREYEGLAAAEPSTSGAQDGPSRPAGFVASSEPEELGLGSTTGLGGAGLGATPGPQSDWDAAGATPGLGSTDGLGLGATPGPGDTPAGGGLGFAKASQPEQSAQDPAAEFERIFARFASAEEVTGSEPAAASEREEPAADEAAAAAPAKEEADSDVGSEEGEAAREGGEDGEAKLSKKRRKAEQRLRIAELKQECPRPDVVEIWDVTAQDPKLLVYLKAYRNSVPVPRHWSQKRKYLQGKRGIEKPAFRLPEFIEATGIGQMRQAYHEKEENKKLKSKQREKMQPKMGKLDIDYQVLHDAFFRHQGKPNLTTMGDLYYEGKEYEAKVRNAKPGVLSEALREALGMSDTSPPPWLINMQRYGPPPSYPDLKIAGLNAPIPPGTAFGYHPGGWGKPPVNELGEPLYGDVFGQYAEDSDDEHVDKGARWGDLESEEEESSDEEEEEEEEGDGEAVAVDTESLADGLTSVVTGFSSLPSGIETPEVLDLRKAKAGGAAPDAARPLYQVLEQQPAQLQAGQLMGTDHTYVLPPAPAAGDAGARRAANSRKLDALRRESGADVEVAIDPEELEGLDETAVKELYERRLAEERARHAREDFSDMVAQKAAQQKRKAQQKESSKAKKQKDKEFQF